MPILKLQDNQYTPLIPLIKDFQSIDSEELEVLNSELEVDDRSEHIEAPPIRLALTTMQHQAGLTDGEFLEKAQLGKFQWRMTHLVNYMSTNKLASELRQT